MIDNLGTRCTERGLQLAVHVLADCIGVTLIVLFAFGLLSGEMLPDGAGTLIAEVWIYAVPISAASHWLLPRLYPLVGDRHWATGAIVLVLALAGISSAGSLLGSVVLFELGLEPGASFAAILSLSMKLAVYLAVLIGVVHSMIILLQARLSDAQARLHATELETERALKLASEARLASLESHVHPHFLFNTLNTISSLISTAPARAETLVERIAAVLRFSLNSRCEGLVPLEHELKVVQDYLEIERERFGERLRFAIELDSAFSVERIPPLSIQTLVENSVKFAVGATRSGAEIRVRAFSEKDALRIEVADTGPGFSTADFRKGHGLENLRSRLRAHYGQAEPLRVTRKKDWTRVAFDVPA